MKNETLIKRLLPLLLLIFIDTVGYFIVIPIIIRLFHTGPESILPANTSTAMRDTLYSITLALSPIAFIICSPLLGHLSDRYGRKITLTGALIASALGFIIPIFGIAKHMISLVLIGRFIEGASSSSQPLAQAAVTDFAAGKRKALYLGMIGFAMTLGMVLGPVLGSYLSDNTLESWFNPTTPYWFAFILSILNIYLILCYYSDDRQHKTTALQQSTSLQLKQLWQIISHKKILILLFSFFFMEIGWSQYYQAIFLILPEKFQYSINDVSLFTAYAGLWMCLGLSVIYKIVIRFATIEKIAQWSLVVTLIGLGLCNIPNVIAQWILMIPTTIAIGTAYPSLLALMSNQADDTHQGYILGSASTMLGAAWMITGLLAGTFIQINTMLPILISGAALLFAAIIFRGSKSPIHAGVDH